MQHIGLIAMTLYWGTVAYILYRWGTDSRLSISDHVARGKQMYLYTPIALLYLVLMSIFLFGWFLPALDASRYHYLLLAIATGALCMTFITPRHGRFKLPHDLYAALVGFLIFFLLASLFARRQESDLVLLGGMGLFSMSIAGSFLLKHGYRGYIQVEVFYFAMFHLLVLLLTYFS